MIAQDDGDRRGAAGRACARLSELACRCEWDALKRDSEASGVRGFGR